MVTPDEIMHPNCDYGIVGQLDAKMALNRNLKLRANKEQPQKLILLEGPPGTGKSTLIKEMCKSYQTKYPGRFVCHEWTVSDLTAHVSTTSMKIKEAWNQLSSFDGQKIVFIDEADEVLQTRKTVGNIRNERTTSIILMLGQQIPNLLMIFASNRPKMIDAAILDRCEERINCDLPDTIELKHIIDMHMEFLNTDLRTILFDHMKNVSFKVNGRDIKNLASKLKSEMELKEIECNNSNLLHEDIFIALQQLERSKRKLKMDYLDDEEDKE